MVDKPLQCGTLGIVSVLLEETVKRGAHEHQYSQLPLGRVVALDADPPLERLWIIAMKIVFGIARAA